MVDSEVKGLTSLGGWANADFNGTALQNVGIGTDTDLPPAVRFIAGVAKLVRRRMATEGYKSDPIRPAIFLLEPAARTHKPDTKPQRIPMLDNGLTAVTGRLWFVNPVVVSGNYVEVDDLNDDALFKIVTEALQLGGTAAIVFDPRTSLPAVRYYPNGLADPDTVESIAITSSDISLDRIFDVIDRVYSTCLVTPEAQTRVGKLWTKGENWWPSEHAEDLIQMHLRVGLTTAFPTCTVRHEQTIVPGRLDLEIEESDPLDRSLVTRYAVLELKVLRNFRTSGASVSRQEVLDWVESGVKQAAAYRKDRNARAAALCCFDMRKDHSGEHCFDHIHTLASELLVKLRVWFIFGTSEQYREFVSKMQNR